MKALYFASLKEQRAVAWFNRSNRGGRHGGARGRALDEVAYELFFKGHDWHKGPKNGMLRAWWVQTSCNPFGAPDFNRMHQLAKICYRRNVYFPEMAKKMGKRRWPDPTADAIRHFRRAS